MSNQKFNWFDFYWFLFIWNFSHNISELYKRLVLFVRVAMLFVSFSNSFAMSFQWISWLNYRSIHLKIWFKSFFFPFFGCFFLVVVATCNFYRSTIISMEMSIDDRRFCCIFETLFSLILNSFIKIANNTRFCCLSKNSQSECLANKCSMFRFWYQYYWANPQKHATVMFGTWQTTCFSPFNHNKQIKSVLPTWNRFNGNISTRLRICSWIGHNFPIEFEYMNWNVD